MLAFALIFSKTVNNSDPMEKRGKKKNVYMAKMSVPEKKRKKERKKMGEQNSQKGSFNSG